MKLTGSGIVSPYLDGFVVATGDDFVVIEELETKNLLVFVVTRECLLQSKIDNNGCFAKGGISRNLQLDESHRRSRMIGTCNPSYKSSVQVKQILR